MKVYIVKTYYDIENNYKGIDDIPVIVCSTKEKAMKEFEIICKNSNDYFKSNYNSKVSDLNTEKREGFYNVNNDKDYITCIIEDKDVI